MNDSILDTSYYDSLGSHQNLFSLPLCFPSFHKCTLIIYRVSQNTLGTNILVPFYL